MFKLFKYFSKYKIYAILAPLFKLLEALLELLIPLIVASIIDKGINQANSHYIIGMVILMVGLGVIGLIFSIAGQFFAAKTAVGFATKLRYDLFKKLESLSFSDIDNLGTSSMITRMTSDINQVQTGINMTLRLFLRSPFVVFGSAIMAYVIDPHISFVFFITIVVLTIIIFGIMIITMPLHRKVQERLDLVLASTRENLTGVRVIRAFTSETVEKEKYDQKTIELEKAQNKVGNISNLMNPLTFIIINLAIIVVIYLGAQNVNIGILLQGEVIALYNYMSQILVELIKLATLIITLTKSVACLKRIAKVMDIDTSIKVLTPTVKKDKPYISFENVSMKYRFSSSESLDNISFNINKGETIGIIGSTGSGKTSLINLLFRFYDVTGGHLYLDGVDIEAYHPDDLRKRFSIVMQNTSLFKGTIRDNLKWGNPDATDEELLEALKIAQGMDIIEKKEAGLDAIVEQKGKNFSGGQRQRLSLARSIVQKAELLVLDDSSSALDYATDANLRKAIKHLDYHPTVIIVSQRTASIANADLIIVLEDGKLVGKGKHDELLKDNDIYQEIYYSQFKDGESNE